MQYNLNDIALKFNCDKSSNHHDYCKVYDRYLSPLRNEDINFLELGYGGYEDPEAGGESANMWREYFTKAKITVVDINNKTNVPKGVGFINRSQNSNSLLTLIEDDQDVILDDASHINSLNIQSFKLLWNKLKPGGLYIVEDLHSSYDKYYKDSNPNPDQGITAMNFFKRLSDELNVDFFNKKYHLGYGIEFVHFYRELVIIKKK